MAKLNNNESELDESQLYKDLTKSLKHIVLSPDEISEPDQTIDDEAVKIYTQAREQRSKLLNFYIVYTIVFTGYVLFVLLWQGLYRIEFGDSNFEIMPQWTLNILVTGMFTQFVGLLTIVTDRVWDLKQLLDHHTRSGSGQKTDIDTETT